MHSRKKIIFFFKIAHENHDHYALTCIFDFLIAKIYWFNKIKNVKKWCRNCHVCQVKLRKLNKNVSFSIQNFESMNIINMNWLNSIFFVCSITKTKYVLIIMNYFTKFVWIKTYMFHTIFEIIDFMRKIIVSIFE